MSKTKKIVLILNEGITDENALAPALKNIEKKFNIRFKMMEGDPLTDFKNEHKSSKEIVGSFVSQFKKRNYLKDSDILLIAQLTDTDGAFISEDRVVIDSHIKNDDRKKYELNVIKVKDEKKQKEIITRNNIKRKHLNTLSTLNVMMKRPYQIFYFSRELEHVLHNVVSIPNKEKSKKADEFSKQYTSFESLKNFFNDDNIATSGDYKQTWNYIKRNNHSLERNTNFHLLLARIESEIKKLNTN